MSSHVRRAILAVAAVVACGPGKPTTRAEDESAALGGEIVARVGDDAIPASLVASVARLQGVPAREAAHRVIEDAVAASGARSRGLDRARPTAWNLVAARGRFTSERLLADARKEGPPTEKEIDELSYIYWLEVDRPPAVRVVHAVVMRGKNATEADPRARALAEQIRAAVADAKDADDFEARANAVQHPDDVAVRVEKLPTFTEEGWITEGGGGGRMDETFARAAFAIGALGDTSAVIETPFGWHVIRLVGRVPEQRMPREERRVAFTSEAHARRARAKLDELVKRLRASHPVTISPAAEQLMRSAMIEGGEGDGQGP